jgi:hypothetical protein
MRIFLVPFPRQYIAFFKGDFRPIRQTQTHTRRPSEDDRLSMSRERPAALHPKALSGLSAFDANPTADSSGTLFRPDSRTGTQPYLVPSMDANTKYSVNDKFYQPG